MFQIHQIHSECHLAHHYQEYCVNLDIHPTTKIVLKSLGRYVHEYVCMYALINFKICNLRMCIYIYLYIKFSNE